MKKRKNRAEKEVIVRNKLGLHARAAAKFIKLAEKYKSRIEITKDSRTVNGKSIMGILTLAAGKGSKIKIAAEGEDCVEAVDALCELVENKFGEDE